MMHGRKNIKLESSVIEMDREQLLLLAHCLPSYQSASISAPTATK